MLGVLVLIIELSATKQELGGVGLREACLGEVGLGSVPRRAAAWLPAAGRVLGDGRPRTTAGIGRVTKPALPPWRHWLVRLLLTQRRR